MKKVTIIQLILPRYRVSFFKRLDKRLLEEEIEFQLIAGENKTQDPMSCLNNFIVRKNKYINFFGKELIYQPYISFLSKSDLVILPLGNKLLLNYILMLRRSIFGSMKIALSGHALNMQAGVNSLKNTFKKSYFKNADWWFPYTEGMAKIVEDAGFPKEKIITVNNTVDTDELIELTNNISNEYVESIRKKLSIQGSPVGIFCGRMYKEKRIDFLLQACMKIKEICPGFIMIFIGGGENGDNVKKAAKQYQWIKYIGPVYGKEKVAYFKLADVFLSPGLVGMSVTESFALNVPMITANYPYHSPEIEYLKNGDNGVITENNLDSYVKGILSVLQDKGFLDRLRNECRESCRIYTMDNMVNRYVTGIKRCLMC